MTGSRMPLRPSPIGISVVPVPGVGEVAQGADLAGLLIAAAAAAGWPVQPGDCLVVSSKVVSKSLGLTWHGTHADAVAAGTVRVVAERWGRSGPTRVVESVAGPVMAAAGVDASNTGPHGELLLLPADPDAQAARLRADLLTGLGLPTGTALAVVLSDTAGRPWRTGLTDLAIGSSGLTPLEDLRGSADHDGRPLAVTMRAVADEVAAAADLVKGKADGIPAAVVRGLPAHWFVADPTGGTEPTATTGGVDPTDPPGPAGPPVPAGAGGLVRVGRGDWFALGHVEAVRAALGVPAGSATSAEIGIRSVADEDTLAERVGRVVRLALLEVPDGSADVGVHEESGSAQVTFGAPDDYDLGRLVSRAEVALASEDLHLVSVARSPGAVALSLSG